MSASMDMPAALTEAEARCVQRYYDRLLAALQARDLLALHDAQQVVLRAAYRSRARPALRRALKELTWRMAGYIAGKQLRWRGRERI
ncbi:hypothetical protein [Variovorax terrae]|uniref:Uncharacterized protein n=1 Tax=Variovorax terrae TaxID=2923278 RepID=A0A9X1VZP2_9BURK|nr:hypothetical protein [Variovorax terrae]MCJ0765149.1 hypothetical protein [Variovorax terrae]